jgi:hypothetical protein
LAKKRKKKKNTQRTLFWFGGSRKKKKGNSSRFLSGVKSVSTATLIVVVLVCLAAAAGSGFVVLEKYTKQSVPVSERVGTLELLGTPIWVNEALQKKIYNAACANGEDLRLDEDVARSVHDNLVSHVAWIEQVQVQTTYDSIRIKAKWRKPLAMVAYGANKFYVDSELTVLDYVRLSDLPIVEVKGLAPVPRIPRAGETFQKDALVAAIEIIDLLDRMDKLVTADKPLLFEIKSIDVSNYNGRPNKGSPHIVFYTSNNTKVIWGAEYGKWQRHLESTDKQKIAKLYEYYKEYGTLNTRIKFINLCVPQDDIPLPIDKY